MTDEVPKPVEPRYAGFWMRFWALWIDYLLVSLFLFPFIALVGTVAPQNIVVSVPFDLFTTEQVVESGTAEQKNDDGSTTIIETELVEVVRLGKWHYLYLDKTERSGGEEKTSRQLLNPETHQEMKRTTSDDLTWLVLLIYWTLMESSRWQASLGKRALGLKVTDESGQRLTLLNALARNFLKILSCITLTIGFMMAGWTLRKQTLHDKISSCLVTRSK
ncbi:MAG: RDD family protein [Nevskiales bacterium]